MSDKTKPNSISPWLTEYIEWAIIVILIFVSCVCIAGAYFFNQLVK